MFNQPSPTGSVVDPAAPEPFAPSQTGPKGSKVSLSSQHLAAPKKESSGSSLIGTVLLLVMTIIAAVAIYFAIQKGVDYHNLKTDIDGQIDSAVAMAVAANTTKMEQDFSEREKYPYRSFLGPVDYGSLGFQYPQTWSVYVARSAQTGGDFEAYLNPLEVEPVSPTTINAMRVIIRNAAFESVVTVYDNLVKNGMLSFTTKNVGGVLANYYSGRLPNGIQGVAVIFKLRDKTVILQTDAALFVDEFLKVLDTVTFIL